VSLTHERALTSETSAHLALSRVGVREEDEVGGCERQGVERRKAGLERRVGESCAVVRAGDDGRVPAEKDARAENLQGVERQKSSRGGEEGSETATHEEDALREPDLELADLDLAVSALVPSSPRLGLTAARTS